MVCTLTAPFTRVMPANYYFPNFFGQVLVSRSPPLAHNFLVFFFFVADFRWFSTDSGSQRVWELRILADNRRFWQETADFCRETSFSHMLSPFWRSPKQHPQTLFTMPKANPHGEVLSILLCEGLVHCFVHCLFDGDGHPAMPVRRHLCVVTLGDNVLLFGLETGAECRAKPRLAWL